jgi:hypothetical protein
VVLHILSTTDKMCVQVKNIQAFHNPDGQNIEHYSGSMSVRIYNPILVAVTSLVKLNIHFRTIKQDI